MGHGCLPALVARVEVAAEKEAGGAGGSEEGSLCGGGGRGNGCWGGLGLGGRRHDEYCWEGNLLFFKIDGMVVIRGTSKGDQSDTSLWDE